MVKKKGQPKRKHVPLRTCVACRETKPKRELVRVVLLPDGTIRVDETGKQNGRGAYLCRQHSCWQKALKQGSLKRALRTQLTPEAFAALEAYAGSLPVSCKEN
ncbi:MAG: YlxR family protein [Anaerolineae bacterium]|nr:YlxR family protein [Anaerolineae bacterium]